MYHAVILLCLSMLFSLSGMRLLFLSVWIDPPSGFPDPSPCSSSVPQAHMDHSTLSFIQQAFVGLSSVPGAMLDGED